MTQIVEYQSFHFDNATYEAQEIDRTVESVMAVEAVGKLIIAQQVGEDGLPFMVDEPRKMKHATDSEEWDAYVAQIKYRRENGIPEPTVAIPARIGTVRTLGEKASYFSVRSLSRGPEALIPFHQIVHPDKRKSAFRLYVPD